MWEVTKQKIYLEKILHMASIVTPIEVERHI